MVNNSININKTNNKPWCQIIEQKKTMTYDIGNPGSNSYDNSHHGLILDNRQKSNRGQSSKSKDNWVPSYV
jgi:hypothetical protein